MATGPQTLPAVAASFARQGLMAAFGARLVLAANGRAVVEVPRSEALTQQHGLFHAGVTSAIADTAAGYAAMTLMVPGASVLTVEFKINLVAPADGDLLRAEARVVRSGRTLTTVSASVEAVRGDRAVQCAEFLGTMIAITGRPESDGPAAAER